MNNTAKYYKITNTSTEPCHMTWNKALMTEEDLEALRVFEQTDDYQGLNEEDRTHRKKVASAIKMRPFLDAIGKDVQIKCYEKVGDGKRVITKPRLEWQFAIGPDVNVLIKEGNIFKARDICERYQIPVGDKDDVKELAKKIKDKFGENKRVITAKQWMESGLRNYEYTEKARKTKVVTQTGEKQTRIITKKVSGFLKAEPVLGPEIKKDDNEQNKNTTA